LDRTARALSRDLSGNRCVHPGSVYDAISARIAEDLGFEVGMFSGSIGSMSVLGAPDLVLLTLTEFAGQAYRICRAGNLALLVDADHGYGNALNVRRAVESASRATAEFCDFDFGASPNLIDLGFGRYVGIGGKDGTYYLLDRLTFHPQGRLIWSARVVFGGDEGGFIGSTAVDGSGVFGATAIGRPHR
jgi:hypothetical protein